MTPSEIKKLFKNISADFKIITRKTELWDLEYCYKVLHDIKILMTFHYLDTASLTMLNHISTPIKVKKYILGKIDRITNDRPGGVDWEDGEGHSLAILVDYNSTYTNLTIEQRYKFQTDYLKLPWTNSKIDASFPHLTPIISKRYSHFASGIDRVDFS